MLEAKYSMLMALRALILCALLGVANAKFWLEDIGHHGISPYHPSGAAYQIFRNVKDFGAIGDGVTDDTMAINAAISAGQRCAPGLCKGSVVSPATVYFPPGTYLISDSIIDFYHTQLIGDPTNRPTIKAAPFFPKEKFGLIDANPYQPGGSLAWNSTNTFFRQIRNLILDTTAMPADVRAVGIHWPSSQATAITNCVFLLSTVPGNQHTGLFIEEGSGGLLNDLYFSGGGTAAILGNQQYTARNLWFYGSEIAISMKWNWGWTFKGAYFKDCGIGIQMDEEQASTGSITLLDSWFEHTDTAITTTRKINDNKGANGTLVMDNVKFNAVNKILLGPDGIILTEDYVKQGGGDMFIMGHVVDSIGFFAQTGFYNLPSSRKPLLLEGGKYYEKSKPQYEEFPASAFLSARAYGVKGDGSSDDTQALNALLKYAAEHGLILHLDAGIYVVTDTVYIPPNSRIVGEAMASTIMAYGPRFQDLSNPRPVVKVGVPGQVGRIEWSDTFVSTRGPCAGAILLEYNLFSDGVPSRMWDIHTRIGGFPGTDLQLPQCPAIQHDDAINPKCIAAFMSMHLTQQSGGLFSENCWFWVADHDLEDDQYQRLTIFAGRGLLIESQRGRIWLSATGSEHHVMYQYHFLNTQNIYMGHLQTESPYFQPRPLARFPFPALAQFNDPDFNRDCDGPSVEPCETSWGIKMQGSRDVAIYGAGLYSFFVNYDHTCSRPNSTRHCQERILSIQDSAGGIEIFGLSTVGTRVMVEQDGRDLIPAVLNNSTFADTLGLYRPV
ncbi:unnamed protein product [Clonostachys chloroleuca]|uniref:Rhamnogalacturonase A/B/Epimerase-like pectate lyase domain-containing protein n=1 Tax=Clonostachys chloroleuca TaxID=1926264 RepID=A0AA35MG91_9HYPO|nr:unnamed protein product [Clonostachys chloroleuca]